MARQAIRPASPTSSPVPGSGTDWVIGVPTISYTAVYEIVGTPITQSVPEPGTGLLVGLAGLIAWRATRPRTVSGAPASLPG